MGFLIRFVVALVLVLATYNPEEVSFSHWVLHGEDGITAPKALTAVVLTIGWVAAFTASWRSLGVIGTGLAGALVGTGLWTVIDWSGSEVSARGINYLVLVSIAFVLAVAMSWSTWGEKIRGLFKRGEKAGAE